MVNAWLGWRMRRRKLKRRRRGGVRAESDRRIVSIWLIKVSIDFPEKVASFIRT